jgi:hypothetical protein
MTDRPCQFCGRELIGKRAGAEYCDSSCRADATRLRQETLHPERQALVSARGAGSRGGNIRTVEDARTLQSVHKPEWTERIRRHIGRTLIATGAFHADDLQPLEVPEIHSAIVGSQIASYVNRRLMVKVGERRCIHKAANGRKAAIYEITPKGRKELVGLDSGGAFGGSAAVESGDSPIGAGVTPGGTEEGRTPTPQGIGADQPDLFDQEPVHLTKTSAYSVENQFA